MAQHTNSFSVEFTGTHSASGWGSSTYGVKVNLVQTYNDNSKQSTISLSSVQIKREGNSSTWSSLPIYGSVYINSSSNTLVSLDNATSGHRAHVSISGSGYCTWTETSVTKTSRTVTHNNDGSCTITVGLTGGYSLAGSSYFGALASQNGNYNVFGVTGSTKSVNLANVGHTLTIDPSGGVWGGSSSSSTFTQAYGTTKTIADPTRDGYDFTGWTLTGGGSLNGTTYTFGASDGTLTAQWSPKYFDVTLTAGNYISAVSGGGSKQYTSSVTATASLGSAAGYSYAFDGWYDENDTLVSSANPYTFTMPAENVSLTAKATRTANSYTVHFDANGGSGTMSDESFVYDQSKALTANAFSRAGYSFLGWSKNQNATSPTYTDAQVVTNLATSGTVTLYAVWSLRSFLLYFSTSHGHISVTRESSPIGGGATGALYSGGTVYTGDEIIITFSADVGYTLTTHTVNAVTFTSGSTYVVSGNTSILQMATANTYYVRFNPNRPTGSGSGSMSNQSFTYDVSQALSQNTFTRYFTATFNANGGTSAVVTSNVYCAFRGWGKSTIDQVVYTDKQSVVNLTSQPNGIVDLYAKWQYGMVVLPTATRPGYTFKGWYSAASGGNKVGNAGNSFQLSQNAVYYAQWEPITYSLSVVTSDNGCTVNVLRTASPYGGGSSGLLNNGATLYYGDALTISYSINEGYQKKTATVNGTAFGTDSGGTTSIASVQASVSVVVQVKLGALVYVANEAYQAFIEDGVVFEQYEAFIDNGASWDAY